MWSSSSADIHFGFSAELRCCTICILSLTLSFRHNICMYTLEASVNPLDRANLRDSTFTPPQSTASPASSLLKNSSRQYFFLHDASRPHWVRCALSELPSCAWTLEADARQRRQARNSDMTGGDGRHVAGNHGQEIARARAER